MGIITQEIKRGDFVNIYREENESIKEYKIRLCRNKVAYGLTFDRIAELVNKETGESKSEGFFRRWWNGYDEGYQDGTKKGIKNDEILKTYEEQRIAIEKEKVKFCDYRSAYRKVVREDARKDILLDIISDKLSSVKPYEPASSIIFDSDNDLLVGLNDLHFGANINNYWNEYNSDIAKQRLEEYIAHIFKIAKTHKSENCYVCGNGDFISGNIHPTIQIANKENVVEQIIGVSELVSWFLAELSSHFKNVYFSAVPGNHSRLSTKDNSPKDERLDDLIPWYVKARLQNISNIIVLDNTIDSTLNLMNIRGLNYVNVHGDYDGHNNIQKLIEMLDVPVYCIHFGHKHHNSLDYIQKYKVIMSGSLMGVDDYCIQNRIYGRAQQLVCVCDNTGIVCTYDVDLQ